MEQEFEIKNEDFEIKIKAKVKNEEQKKHIQALINIMSTNLSLLDTDLLNTCVNLTHSYSSEILENISDYSFANNIEMDRETQDILDQFNRSYYFK